MSATVSESARDAARRRVATGLAVLFMVCFFAALGGFARTSASGDLPGHARVGEVLVWWGIIATFGVLMIVAVVVATPPGRRWSTRQTPVMLEATDAAVPALNGVHWLQRSPGAERRVRQAAIISCVMLLFCGLILWQGYDRLKRHAGSHPNPAIARALDQYRKGIMAEGLIMMTLLFQLAVELRGRRVRLGTDGRQVLAELSSGELLTVSAERVVYDRRSIAFENCWVRISTPKGRSLYEAREVETYLAPLLGRARKLGPFGMLGYRFVHREGALVATLLCYVLCAVLFFVTGAWQPLWAGLLKKLRVG